MSAQFASMLSALTDLQHLQLTNPYLDCEQEARTIQAFGSLPQGRETWIGFLQGWPGSNYINQMQVVAAIGNLPMQLEAATAAAS
jgi:hypothetical protein